LALPNPAPRYVVLWPVIGHASRFLMFWDPWLVRPLSCTNIPVISWLMIGAASSLHQDTCVLWSLIGATPQSCTKISAVLRPVICAAPVLRRDACCFVACDLHCPGPFTKMPVVSWHVIAAAPVLHQRYLCFVACDWPGLKPILSCSWPITSHSCNILPPVISVLHCLLCFITYFY
jgi:hypothetical protein